MHFYDYITDFIFVENSPKKADAIFIPGGPCGETAVTAARLYREGYSEVLIPSGKHSVLNGAFAKAISPEPYSSLIYPTEADLFSAILKDHGVLPEHIYPERRATFTYENAIYTKLLLDDLKIPVKTALLCCQAYHARRSLLYYQAVFPNTRILVCPTETRGIRKKDWHQNPDAIDMVLGEVERCGSQFHDILKNYPHYTVPLH